ncbi:hypothetical protein E3J62_08895 [candidate division TA06 bacterium]|uniref:Fibronectin type-III domain-containing protein n=1 Tax=candidate division TA06 bacterium TaxID=2250710 RepID=A0A523UR03_UNCT6|nr:MAG: hypothetical protein E3J62_08895 [candidate division TA06 bacterium]
MILVSLLSAAFLIGVIMVSVVPSSSQEIAVPGPPAPPTQVTARDTPSDGGGSITVHWQLSADDAEGGKVSGYGIYRSPDAENYEYIGYTVAGTEEFEDTEGVEDGNPYYYRVISKSREYGDSEFSTPSPVAFSRPQLFHLGRLNALIAIVIFVFLILYYVGSARKGKKLFIRRIAGLDAIDEAVGRATEMGKPILFVPGLSSMSDVATIAAINILGPVAKKVAEYETTIIVPNRNPIVATVTREVVKGAYLEAGRPDAFREDSVFFITTSQFAYTAAVDGIMVREKPATNLFLGMFFAESLILAETGASTGAIQIAGTDAVSQLPFFVTACDYTIIGEELYAASAYLSREPKLLGSLKAQDWGKVVILFFIIVGTVFGILKLPGFASIRNLFNV